MLTVWGNASREKTGWNNKLTFHSLYLWRLGVPAFFYFWMSLVFTTVSRAFQIPMQASVGRAGFVVLWMLNYCTLFAIGLSMESTLSLLTAKFIVSFQDRIHSS
jgi:hypothetical protein